MKKPEAHSPATAVAVASTDWLASEPRRGAHSKRKDCCCGGHNASNPKKNRHHNSTKKRLIYRRGKKGERLRGVDANMQFCATMDNLLAQTVGLPADMLKDG